MVVRELIESGMLKGKPERLQPGSCLFKAGEQLECFYFVMSGSVSLTPAVDAPLPAIASENNLLGLPDLMNERYSHTAKVLEVTDCVRLQKEDLLEALQCMPHLRLYLLRQMSRQTTLANAAFE